MALLFSLPSRMEDLALFTRHVAGAMQARAPLPDILLAYQREAEASPLSRVLGEMADRLRKGVPLSEVVDAYPRIFPASYRRLVQLGEQGRALAGVMSRLADQLEEGLKHYEFFRRAAIYPLILCIILFLDICFVLAYILPKFQNIYSELGGDIGFIGVAASSRFAGAGYATFVVESFGLLLLLPILFLLATLLGLRVRGVGYGRFALSIPVIGTALRRAETARFASHLALLLENRIPLAEALGLMADASENAYVRAVITDFQARYQRGERLSDLMSAQPLFPPTMAAIVGASEDQGGLAETLRTLGRFYAERTSHSLTILREVFEPVMLILIGLLVAFILLSLYAPLFQLSQNM